LCQSEVQDGSHHRANLYRPDGKNIFKLILSEISKPFDSKAGIALDNFFYKSLFCACITHLINICNQGTRGSPEPVSLTWLFKHFYVQASLSFLLEKNLPFINNVL
jgi:hypothetical protein